ncbi:MAG: S46 family peptidase [Acidobacteria bacterium]|nr:S46 family peptidase [Acidobacteriota bacterium]
MNRKAVSLTSFVLILAVIISTVSPGLARWDEGMFMPDRIASLDLKKKGLKIKPEEIYNPKGGGLTDAVIRLSIGCSAEFVSPEGLILTNHHCAFDALVSASTPENDLVEHGFKADNRSGEISARNYSIFITERIEDVTSKIRQGTDGLSGDGLAAALEKNTAELQKAEQEKASKGSTIRIQSMNNGYFHYLFQTRQIQDIRVVYAPPRNIGVFGGDPDNFEWTRHTGDFTFLRAYTAPDGSSAPYSANNVPYKAKKFLTMNADGVKDGDFVFVLGYPGATTRYRESQSIEYARDANFPFLAAWLDARSRSLREIGETDEEKRIAYQSQIANFDNAFKVFDGGRWRLLRSKVVEKRRAEEQRFAQWVEADPKRREKYGTVLSELAEASAESNRYAKRDILVRRMPDATMPMFRTIYQAVAEGKMLPDAERQAKAEEIKKALEGRETAYERDMLKFFLRSFDELPADQKFDGAENLFKAFSGKERRAAEDAFAENIAEGKYWNAETVAALYGPQTMDFRPERDNVKAFAAALKRERDAANARAAAFASKIDRLRLLYQQGMAEMKGITPYPDANSTLRFSYGNVKGYSPRESEFRTPLTTLKGMWEKDTGVDPWDMPQKIKDLDAAKDFGRWRTGDSVIVNFLSTNDIIGGNSGSPILDAKGRQVGICFDGNYEGLGNDFYYDPNMNRTISVDIRFVLFVTEKVAGAGWILDEMNIVGGAKTK